MKFKYLVFENAFGIEVPVTFGTLAEHIEMAVGKNVISAGFVTITPEARFICEGHSTSLNKGSRFEVDADLIERSGIFGARH